MRDVAKTWKCSRSAIIERECNQELRIAGNFLSEGMFFACGRINATDEGRNFRKAFEYIIGVHFVLPRIHKTRIGNGSDTHIRGFPRGDTGKRVLDDEACLRRDFEFLCSSQINVGMWLALLNFITSDYDAK